MKKKLFKNIMTFSALCVLGVTGCSDSTQAYSSGERTTQEISQTAPMQQSQETNEDENDTEPTASESVGILDNFMLVYAQAHSASSSVSITYPVFLDSKAEELNSIIHRKVQEVGQIDTALFSPDAALTAEYKSAVTLKNSKIVSIIFWGESSVDNSPDKTTNLTSINVDLQSMKELTLNDLYTTNEDFKKVFFEKAFFPENPITSYDKELFHNMLQLQSPEYQTVDPFTIPGNVICFLKPDGIALSMPSIHATGSDHFEAQINYSDIQKFYLPEHNYWENCYFKY
uniref:hypothetical protein n=1 Tax=Enterocloster clostridioformis TaxID=1531 RepID=UPI0035210731